MLKPITIQISGLTLTLNPRAFDSGKLGYGYYGKLPVDGTELQVSVNLVVPKSEASQTDQAKTLRKEQQAAKAAREAKRAK